MILKNEMQRINRAGYSSPTTEILVSDLSFHDIVPPADDFRNKWGLLTSLLVDKSAASLYDNLLLVSVILSQ
jgi:hypothetical protein